MATKFKTLYKRNSTGTLQEWTLHVKDNGYYVVEGLVGGKLTQTEPHICDPKSAGKKNATTANEQALKEAQAKYDNKLAHGHSLTKVGVDATGYKEPMLAKQYRDYKDTITWPVYIDDKLNGVRMNALEASVKSRKGKPFNTIPHIEEAIAPLFQKYPTLFLDGELFNKQLKNHLNRLIELVSVACKTTDLTPELLEESKAIVQFHIYDGYGFEGITPTTPFIERRKALQGLLKNIQYTRVLEYVVCNNDSEVQTMLKKAVVNKDEGLIVRWGDCPYEHKRSKYLLKLKNFEDDEFEIEEVQEGNGAWANCAKRIVLKLPKPSTGRDGKIQTNFASNIEGNKKYLEKMWQDRRKMPGKLVTCRFQNYSEYGVPQIPYVIAVRGYE